MRMRSGAGPARPRAAARRDGRRAAARRPPPDRAPCPGMAPAPPCKGGTRRLPAPEEVRRGRGHGRAGGRPGISSRGQRAHLLWMPRAASAGCAYLAPVVSHGKVPRFGGPEGRRHCASWRNRRPAIDDRVFPEPARVAALPPHACLQAGKPARERRISVAPLLKHVCLHVGSLYRLLAAGVLEDYIFHGQPLASCAGRIGYSRVVPKALEGGGGRDAPSGQARGRGPAPAPRGRLLAPTGSCAARGRAGSLASASRQVARPHGLLCCKRADVGPRQRLAAGGRRTADRTCERRSRDRGQGHGPRLEE